jgi:thiamine biosynthesis lipoprotein
MKIKDFLKRLYPVFLVLLVFIVWKYRETNRAEKEAESQENPVEITGMTMGTIRYSVKYFQEDEKNYSAEIDSLLKVWNLSLSTYIPESEISRFNSGDSCFQFESKYFLPVLKASKRVYEKSGGAFDPTVGPLVNAWGFGPEKSMTPDSSRVDSLRTLVGFNKISFDEDRVCKNSQGIKLDFSAIAKGNAVDIVADFLESKGIENLLVEIGGEIVCRGSKPGNAPWVTAIEDPTVKVYDQKILAIAELFDKAVATSGNYRNYYVQDGRKYAHTINPATGYPVFHELLSASVFAENCMIADAYATAFMVLGLQGALKILEGDPTLDAYLIYTSEDGELKTFVTDGIADYIKKYDAE